MRTTNPWVTDRLPTQEDGDDYGNVHKLFERTEEAFSTEHWSQISSVGIPWRHTASWNPPALDSDDNLVQRICTLEKRVGELEDLIKAVAQAPPSFLTPSVGGLPS